MILQEGLKWELWASRTPSTQGSRGHSLKEDQGGSLWCLSGASQIFFFFKKKKKSSSACRFKLVMLNVISKMEFLYSQFLSDLSNLPSFSLRIYGLPLLFFHPLEINMKNKTNVSKSENSQFDTPSKADRRTFLSCPNKDKFSFLWDWREKIPDSVWELLEQIKEFCLNTFLSFTFELNHWIKPIKYTLNFLFSSSYFVSCFTWKFCFLPLLFRYFYWKFSDTVLIWSPTFRFLSRKIRAPYSN